MRVLILFLVLFSFPVQAAEIGEVSIPETVKNVEGAQLQLNGVGIRSKFFFEIYIAQLYLEQPATSAEQVLQSAGAKRVTMHFLYDTVEKDKLVDAWNIGFTENTSPELLETLQERIDQFNALFVDAHKGDVIVLDYVPGKGTVVMLNDQEKGIVEGKDFNDALLNIWLGKKPVTKKLKKKLLKGGSA